MNKRAGLFLIVCLLIVSACGTSGRITYRNAGHHIVSKETVAVQISERDQEDLNGSPEFFTGHVESSDKQESDSCIRVNDPSADVEKLETSPVFGTVSSAIKKEGEGKLFCKTGSVVPSLKKDRYGHSQEVDALAVVALIFAILAFIAGVAMFLSQSGVALVIFLVSALVGHVLAAIEMGVTIGRPSRRKSFNIALIALLTCILGLFGWLVYIYVELG